MKTLAATALALAMFVGGAARADETKAPAPPAAQHAPKARKHKKQPNKKPAEPRKATAPTPAK